MFCTDAAFTLKVRLLWFGDNQTNNNNNNNTAFYTAQLILYLVDAFIPGNSQAASA